VIQRLIEAFLFFHPAVWFVSNRIRREREHCCDDLAAACAGVLVAGLTLGLFQSYLYAAGNNATAALWIGALLLVGLVRDNDAERV
jgi:hypothetical protein